MGGSGLGGCPVYGVGDGAAPSGDSVVPGPADVTRLAGLQGAILDGAAGCVRSGGNLVYAVCSREPEEGEQVIADFLARHPEFSQETTPPAFFREGRSALLTGGSVTTWPHRHETDGFFAGMLRRN